MDAFTESESRRGNSASFFTVFNYERITALLQGLGITFTLLFLVGCSVKKETRLPASHKTLTVLLAWPPVTLDPLKTFDADGQRFGDLLFRSLTKKDQRLFPQPDLAESWKQIGTDWRFSIAPGLKDHDGQAITAPQIATCLENYRRESPLFAASIPNWTGTSSDDRSVTLHLKAPEPYILQNLSAFRYFRVEGPRKTSPCEEPKPGDRIIGSGSYRAERFRFEDLSPESEITLHPVSGDGPNLHFLFGTDDNTKALQLIRGEVDVAFNGISLSKTRWVEKNFSNRFRVMDHEGVTVSYLNFNVRSGPLADVRVRRAITMAINRQDIIDHKLFGYGELAQSLLHPLLAESASFPPPAFDPDEANHLLDQAGYPRGPDGVRMHLRYKTTPVREGFETALIFREMLARVGIALGIEVVEPAVFFSSVRKGAFELYSSRWVGISDASILNRVLLSTSPDNRGGYKNAEMDALLRDANAEADPAKRIDALKKVQKKIAQDLPFVPLWYWKYTLILKNGLQPPAPGDFSLNASFYPLTTIR